MNYQFDNKDAYLYLRLLTEQEQESFITFLESKYFNTDLVLVALVKVLQKYQKKEDISKCNLAVDLTKEAKKTKVYKGKAKVYSSKTINNKFTDLSKLLIRFLKIKAFEADELLQNQVFIEQIIYRGKRTDTLLELKDRTKDLVKSDLQKLNDKPQFEFIYQNQFKLYLLDYVLDVQTEKTHRIKETSLQSIYDNIDYDHWLKKIKYAFVMLNREQIVNTTYDFRDLKPLLTYLQNQDLTSQPILYLYYHLVILFAQVYNYPFALKGNITDEVTTDLIERTFNQILQYLQSNKNKIIKNEQLQIYTALSNLCVKLQRLGKTEYLEKRKEIYKYTLKEKVILVEGKISANHFCNLIKIGATLGDSYWIDECMNYKNKVSKKIAPHIETYNKALIYFMNKKFQEALLELDNVKDDIDFVYDLDKRTLNVKIYYELIEKDYSTRPSIRKERINNLTKSLDRFGRYLKYDTQNKTLVHEERYKAHKAFIEVVQKLLNEIREDKFTKGSILDKINSSSPIVEKKWLLAKYETLTN